MVPRAQVSPNSFVQMELVFWLTKKLSWKQEAHGPQLAHLSETATADMQLACNIFPVLSNIETYDKAMA